MPVRLRITLLFVTIVTVILGILCISIYYVSYTERISKMKTRLTNRALTTGKLLQQKEIFDQKLLLRIDSLTTIAIKNKTVQAYDSLDREVYKYCSVSADSVDIDDKILDDTRNKGKKFFTIGNKEVIALHFTGGNANMVIISAGEDEEGKQALQSLMNILLFSFLTGIAFVLIAGYIFSAGLLLPVRRITEDVKEISAQNLARRIKTGKARDEWYQLASTLNDLLNRFQESFELQRRFISNASHELSTPLTSISSQIEVSLQRERGADEYKAVLHSIYQDVRNMSKLTQTLLEFAKAAGNPGGLEIKLVRIDEIILRLPSEMIRINPQYSVLLQFEELPENEEHLLVFGNEVLLLTAIKNIVVNGCKYSPDHQAKVNLTVRDGEIRITVSDSGMGIPEDKLKTIFQPFYRLEENLTNEGFGLGLSLADRIIKLHKGAIEVDSKINAGTSFTIMLPPAGSLK